MKMDNKAQTEAAGPKVSGHAVRPSLTDVQKH